MVQVCERTKTKHDMLAESIEQYKDMYVRARGEFNKVVSVSVSGYGTSFRVTQAASYISRAYASILKEMGCRDKVHKAEAEMDLEAAMVGVAAAAVVVEGEARDQEVAAVAVDVAVAYQEAMVMALQAKVEEAVAEEQVQERRRRRLTTLIPTTSLTTLHLLQHPAVGHANLLCQNQNQSPL